MEDAHNKINEGDNEKWLKEPSEYNKNYTNEDWQLTMWVDMRTGAWDKENSKWRYPIHLECIDYYILQ